MEELGYDVPSLLPMTNSDCACAFVSFYVRTCIVTKDLGHSATDLGHRPTASLSGLSLPWLALRLSVAVCLASCYPFRRCIDLMWRYQPVCRPVWLCVGMFRRFSLADILLDAVWTYYRAVWPTTALSESFFPVVVFLGVL